jgi:gamma-glutamylcyclotransferase (GGCT)/AIG2-like uncharacterized protein YtfP
VSGLLFVYGTLLRDAKHSMHDVLARHAELVGDGFFNGRLYQVGHYSGVVPSSEPDDRVFGELYRLRDAADVLLRLDEYEGCGPTAPKPTEFIRKVELVTLANGTKLQAWLYVYNRPVHRLERIRSGSFLQSGSRFVKTCPGDGSTM